MSIDLDSNLRQRIVSWAASKDSIREIWLFGSRARGDARADSDIDLAIVLMPPLLRHPGSIPHDWALGNYASNGDAWQRELASTLGRHVSLEAIRPGTNEYDMVVRTGHRLWSRQCADQ